MSLSSSLKKLAGTQKKRLPVWKGPEQDGISYSLLARWLVCKERFRLLVVEGLKPRDAFNSRLEFGSMWHVCEESHAKEGGTNWQPALLKYAQAIAKRYPLSQDQINHWYEVCCALFPLYVEHWSQHPDVQARQPLLQEQVFDVPYKLPSGRTVRLRGKWDSVDLVGKGKEAGVWLQENKTKSAIDGDKIQRQLSFDLQTMLYAVALMEERKTARWPIEADGKALLGVRYNVVRRSAHKSIELMLKKVKEDQENGRIGEWFARWNVRITPGDITKFRRECLDPILENLCWWWENITNFQGYGARGTENMGAPPPSHWRHPFNVYNVLDEGGSSELDAYLAGEGEVGLMRTDDLFPELKGA